ncbi:hypothetical protein VitviT2T_016025 [Vitis vinifera]|uniref:Uncharacterized protein n=1 Tax=Vitis vinifera TaxID=29760 RepID=A0ABY9CRS2_VITVI|nr:hypothetical protein VitviT2T_016025 [Vitis vinifera]
MSVRGFEMALVCQRMVSQLRNSLRNEALAAKSGSFYALEILRPFRSCEMREATPAEQTMPYEETTTAEVETPIQSTQETTAKPSSPHDPPTTT